MPGHSRWPSWSQWRPAAHHRHIEQLYACRAGGGVFKGLLGSVCMWSGTLMLIGGNGMQRMQKAASRCL